MCGTVNASIPRSGAKIRPFVSSPSRCGDTRLGWS